MIDKPRILITGCKGFLGKEFLRLLNYEEYDITGISRADFDLTDTKECDLFFEKHNFDFIIHCAVSGGRRNHPDGHDVLYNNLLMFENLAKHRDKYNLMITFGSGAEGDKTSDIDARDELSFTLNSNHVPQDSYGLSKAMIANRIEGINDNIVNLRIFNVFGPHEAPDRMIKNNIHRYLDGKHFEIHQDRWMDFFGINDLCSVVEFLMDNPKYEIYDELEGTLHRSINMCYPKKTRLTDIAMSINDLGSNTNTMHIRQVDMSPPYTGDGGLLASMPIKLRGLESELRSVYEAILDEN